MTIHTKHAHVDRALDVSPLYAGVVDAQIPRAHLGQEGMSADLALRLTEDFTAAVQALDAHAGEHPAAPTEGFHQA